MNKQTEALKLAEDALKRVRTQDMELVQLSMIALAVIKEALAEQPAQQQEPISKLFGTLPVYDKLAQRKPLTDEQIDAIADEYLVDYRIPAGCAWNFARDIEAAHGIKGDA